MTARPRILVLADVPGWAWGRKARAYATHLGDRFQITVAYHAAIPALAAFDLVHLFEVSQVGVLTPDGPRRPFKAVAGLTAHVWPTWGPAQMHAWAQQVDALHGNSRLLVRDLAPFHPRVYYTPNGVDPTVYRRVERKPPEAPVVFGHVGKPTPRKGGDLIIQAARAAGVDLRLIQRTAKVALSEDEMVAWYQGIDVMVTASNMDGTPNPMLEGAACDCALLSTPIGNMPEVIVPGGNGALLTHPLPCEPPHQPAAERDWDAAERLRRRGLLCDELTATLATWAQQPHTVRNMGASARQTILDGWTWQQQVEPVAHMWQEVLDA